MEAPVFRFVFDRNKRASKTKLGLVQIEVGYCKKRKWLTTGVKVYADQWNKGQVVNRVDAYELNEQLGIQIKKIREWTNGVLAGGETFSFEALEGFLTKQQNKSESFLDFIRTRIEERPLKESTKKQHYVMLHVVEEFGLIKYFSDLTTKNIKLFDDYLHSMTTNQSTVHGYHKRLKTYINEAIAYEYIAESPYKSFKVPKGKETKRKYLTPEELKKVETVAIKDKTVEHARDCFVFCCYTGLAYSDLAKFDWDKDVVKREGKCFIEDARMKTETPYKIQILSPAMRMLEKHKFKLPVVSNQKYNMYLKLVTSYAGIEKELTSHMARHTFAVFALNNNVRIEVVSKMLAHRDITTTQIYAKLLQSEVEAGFDVLEDKIQKSL